MTLPPLGAVLAGGAATRIGGAKAAVELDGRPLIAYPLGALAEAQLEAIVVAKAGSLLPPLDTPIITEPDEPRHPLAGVVAAMKHAGDRPVVVVPCDAPFITSMLLRVLASAASTTAVRAGGRTHPLIALYTPEHLSHLEQATNDGQSATQALESLDPEYIEAPERETFNINTPEDLAKAEETLRPPRS
ncbi:MAG TPA: molybdenum cofactor guanylyltransferase [Solirubrobacterales bacterium]|nr:molybdenum cofactor guanylyltransferase [Solirubrobacterales bacterium]